MPVNSEPGETILLVDDEEPVRKTFREWLESAGQSCRILTAADAEAALVLANQNTIDLAILDWNLGAGNDGLHLLEDLYLFNPDVVAILVTGFAHQATPLDAMRMGVRDYLDKNQQLDRTTFLNAVGKQLERIRPLKRERRLQHSLNAFRAAVEKVLPLVRSAQALSDPMPLPEAIGSLFRFLRRTTNAADGVLLVRSYDPNRNPEEIYRAYDPGGHPLTINLVPFSRSLAGSVVSLQEPYLLNRMDQDGGTVDLQPFERGRHSLLAAPLAVASGLHVVLELFDKQGPSGIPAPGGFSEEDRRLAAAAADIGAELLRQSLAKEQVHEMLIDAMAAALTASETVAETLQGGPPQAPREALPAGVMDQLRQGFSAAAGATFDGEDTLRLAEAIRVLSVQHGPAAVQHCIQLVESVRSLLDRVTDSGTLGTR
jgi:two-component system nitrogen regulation response regulator NtrX